MNRLPQPPRTQSSTGKRKQGEKLSCWEPMHSNPEERADPAPSPQLGAYWFRVICKSKLMNLTWAVVAIESNGETVRSWGGVGRIWQENWKEVVKSADWPPLILGREWRGGWPSLPGRPPRASSLQCSPGIGIHNGGPVPSEVGSCLELSVWKTQFIYVGNIFNNMNLIIFIMLRGKHEFSWKCAQIKQLIL